MSKIIYYKKRGHKKCFNIWSLSKGSRVCLFCQCDWNSAKQIDMFEDSDDSDTDSEYDDSEYDDSDIEYESDHETELEKFAKDEYEGLKYGSDADENYHIDKLNTFRIKTLQDMCKINNLPFYGTKAVLSARLIKNGCIKNDDVESGSNDTNDTNGADDTDSEDNMIHCKNCYDPIHLFRV